LPQRVKDHAHQRGNGISAGIEGLLTTGGSGHIGREVTLPLSLRHGIEASSQAVIAAGDSGPALRL
jgi:hypothetical protein